jgi:hypothetical protein
MKKIVVIILFSANFFSGCSNYKSTPGKTSQPLPKPGTVVTNGEMPVTDDPLNHFTFSVTVIADSEVGNGVYDVNTAFGPNTASGKFTMPKGGESFKPILRAGSQPYTYIIGFKAPGDTAFYDYFEVSSNRHTTKMQYIKTYIYK